MVSRRNFLKAAFLLTAAMPVRKVFAFAETDRILHLYNIHTGERLSARYFESGTYNHDTLNKINYLMKCHYTNEILPMDVNLLDLLCAIKDVFGHDREVHIISGFRSRAYNEYLRSIGRKVVQNSLHLYGLAIDFAIPCIGVSRLLSVAKSFPIGGVGKYPEFVHIDVGRVRYW